MNILLVSPLPPPSGGMATWTEQYLKNNKSEDNIFVVNTAFIGKRALHRGGKKNLFSELKRLYLILFEYYKTLKEKKIDVIHINSACSKIGIFRDAICVALGKKYPIVFHCHCNIQDQLRGSISQKLGKYIFNSVDYVLVLNEESFSYVDQQSNVKLSIMPNSIDSNFIKDSFKVEEELKNIIYVGHVKRGKGIFEIIEVASKMYDIIFHLVGPVSNEIAEINLPSNVICYGRKEHIDAINLMSTADAFLFPSYTEGFSMVMLEAMAVGLPIIASNVGANRDMIEEKGGIIVSPKVSDEIISAIEMIRSKKVRSEMSKWNLEKVKNNYRSEKISKLLQEVYCEISL